MKTKTKQLKKYNGRPHGIFERREHYLNAHINIAAYSQKQAAEILDIACGYYVGTNEISKYYSPCWGNDMNGIEPTEPSVWVVYRNKTNTETIREQVYPKKS